MRFAVKYSKVNCQHQYDEEGESNPEVKLGCHLFEVVVFNKNCSKTVLFVTGIFYIGDNFSSVERFGFEMLNLLFKLLHNF